MELMVLNPSYLFIVVAGRSHEVLSRAWKRKSGRI